MSMRACNSVVISLLLGLAIPALADEPAAPEEKAGEAGAAVTATAPPEAEVTAAGETGAAAEEEKEDPFTFWGELTGATSYVWRGERFSGSNLGGAVQPEVEIESPGLGPGSILVNLWMNRAFTSDQGVPDSPLELDVLAAYKVPIGPLNVRFGYIVYYFLEALPPEPVDNQHEISVVGRYETEALPVKPFAGLHVDPFRYKGAYASAGVVHNASFLGDKLSFETTLNLGVSGYDGIDFGLQDITLTSRGELLLGDYLYAAITLGVAYAGRAGEGQDRILPYALLAIGFGN